MHAASLLEEQAEFLWDRLPVAENVFEHAPTRSSWMDALRHLRQLERVAEKDEAPRGGAACERVGEAVLPGLVHDESIELTVELFARVEPGGACDEQHLDAEDVGEVAGLDVFALEVVAVLDAAEVDAL